MSLTKDGFWKQIGGVIGDNSYVLLGGGSLIKYGNATGNIPLSNGTKNTDLNADLLDGYHADTLLSNASLGTNGNNITLSITVGGKNINTGSATAPYAGKTDIVRTQTDSSSATRYLTFVDSNNSSADYENIYTNSQIIFNPYNGSFGHGNNVNISGQYSHAEGSNTTASGQYSHAEGLESSALGARSHAEGHGTTADGPCAHAEGMGTVATGNFTHAEGYYSKSYGRYSHVEGLYCCIIATGEDENHNPTGGEGSHCEGYCSYIYGAIGAHAEGIGTFAYGYHSHTEGKETRTYGEDSHAEGYQSISYGQASHVEGYCTTTYGLASHTSGFYTIANNDYEAAFGKFNQSNSNTIFSVGGGTSVNRYNLFEIRTDGSLLSQNGTILTTGNFNLTVSGGGSSLGSSITITINNVPTTLTIPSSINWSDITGKPPTFSPSTHEHYRIKFTDDHSKYPAQLTGNTTQALFGSFMNNSKLGINTTTYGNYSDALVIRGYSDSTGGKENAIIFNKNSTNVWHTQFDFGSTTSWGTPYMFLDTNNWTDVVDGRYLKLSGGTMTGNLTMGGIDLYLGTSSSSSNESADLVFLYGNGNEKLRIWSDDTYTTIKGPNIMAKKSDGTELYSTTLALSTHIHALSIASDSGTPSVTLSHNTTYKLTAGGSTFIFKTPSDNNNKVKQEESTTSSWRPLLLGYNSNSTVNSGLNNTTTNQTYLSNNLCFNPGTSTLAIKGSLWLRPDGDATLKIYSGKVTDSYSDGFIKLQTSINGTDGSSDSDPGSNQARCALFLQPRGGEVYIGKDITSANTSADTNYKLNVGGAAQFDLSISTYGHVWAGLTTSTIEHQVGVKSINGDFYMFAQGSSDGARGIYINPHGNGVGKALIFVDTNNNVTFDGNLLGNASTASFATSANYLGFYDAAYTNPGYGTGSLSYYSYDASYAMSSSVNGKSNPTSGWYHHLLMIHPDPNGYFCDVAWELTNNNDPKMYYRVRNSGLYSDWVSVLTNKNYTSYIENYLSDLELTIAASLNDLNSRINSISSGSGSITHTQTTNTNNHYVLGVGDGSQPSNGSLSQVYSDNNFYFTHSGAYHASDARKKYDIRDILNEDVNKLFETENGFIRHFKWKDSNINSYGFIAQELQEYCPEAVDFNEDDGFYAVNYNVAFSKIIGVMFKKIKELERKLQEKENH